jgi:hypothetical protein
MALFHPTTNEPAALLRTLLVIAAIVILATIVTLVFAGDTLLSFDLTPNPMPAEWAW